MEGGFNSNWSDGGKGELWGGVPQTAVWGGVLKVWEESERTTTALTKRE